MGYQYRLMAGAKSRLSVNVKGVFLCASIGLLF